MSEKSKTVSIIKNLVSLVGVTVGIIISAIGAIMFLESILKIYVFDIKQDGYSSYTYRCEKYDVDSIEARRLVGVDNLLAPRVPVPVNKNKVDLTEKQREILVKKYKECKAEAKKESEESFINREKMDIATGIAFVLVGLPLLYFYQRRRRDKK